MAMKTADFFKPRIHVATIEQHNGNQDELGHPTYTNDADWRIVVPRWPCELLTASGGERLRGRGLSASTTHVFIGEWAAVQNVTPDMRLNVGGKIYNITAVYEPDGLNREMRIEARQSW